MKALNRLADRALGQLLKNGEASAAELYCAPRSSCGSRGATFKYINGKSYFYTCGCII